MTFNFFKKITVGLLAFLIVFSPLASVTHFAYADINPEINYQGKLLGSTGSAVSDGTYEMTFNLYTVSSGGSAIWTEQRNGSGEVEVTSGLFSVMLGEVNSLSGVDFNQPLWLGVTVESDSEMTPRKQLGTVPAAFVSQNSLALGNATSTQFLRSDVAGMLTVSTSSTGLIINQSGSGDILNLQDGGSEVLTVVDGGNVGIGTTTPGTRLAVAGTSRFTGASIFDSTLSASGAVTFSSTLGVTGHATLATASSTNLTVSGNSYLGTVQSGTWNGGVISSSYLDSSLILSGEIDSSSELGSIVTDETGSGSLVFGTSPTFTTNANFFGDTISDFTGTGLVLSGSTLTVSTSSLGITSSQWTTSGSNIYYNGGNVGIGTTTPANKLAVSSDQHTALSIDTTTTANSSRLYFTENAAVKSSLISVGSAHASTDRQNDLELTSFSGDMTFWPGGAQAVTFKSGGNVGIGTTTPGTKLDISAGGVSGAGALRFSDQPASINDLITVARNNGTLGWKIQAAGGSQEFFRISDSGGTPRFLLEVSSAGNGYFNAGNFGFGTTTPSAKVSITGTAGTGDVFAVASSTNARLLTVTSAGKVGIGTASPSELLTVQGTNGQFKVDNFGRVAADVGDINNPSYGFTNVTGTGLNFDGTVLGLSYYGSALLSVNEFLPYTLFDSYAGQTLALNSVSGGNVGIGTTTASDRLSVEGSVNLTGALKFNDSAGTSGQVLRSTGTGAQWVSTSTLGITSSQWTTSGGNIFYNSGSVGIGTSSPGAKLHIDDPTNTVLRVSSGSRRISLAAVAADTNYLSSVGASLRLLSSDSDVQVWTNNAPHTYFNTSGQLLLATTSTASLPGISTYAYNTTGIFFPSTGVLGFSTASTERMRIDSSGNVGIGTTTPDSKLQVKGGAIGLDNAQRIRWRNAAGNANQDVIYLDTLDNTVLTSGSGAIALYDGSSSHRLDVYNGATVASRIQAGGTSYINGGDFVVGGTSSLARSTVYGTSTSQISQLIRIAPSQTADSLVVEDSAGNDLLRHWTASGLGSVLRVMSTSTKYFQMESYAADNNYFSAAGAPFTVRTSGGQYNINFFTNTSDQRMTISASTGHLIVGSTATNGNARLHSIWNGGAQLRLGTDISNTAYMDATVSSTGLTTFNSSGSDPSFAFSDAVSVSAVSGSSTIARLLASGTSIPARLELLGTNGSASQSAQTFIEASSTGSADAALNFYVRKNGDSFNSPGLAASINQDSVYFKGNVGIGTTTPGMKLDIYAGAGAAAPTIRQTFTDATSYTEWNLIEGTTFKGGLAAFGSSYSTALWRDSLMLTAATNNTGSIIFRTRTGGNYAERLIVTNSGNVAIGTTTATTTLEVYAGASNTPNGITLSQGGGNSGRLFFYGGTPGAGHSIYQSFGTLLVNTGATPGVTSGAAALAVSSTGSVGIGTTTPGAKLDIFGGDLYFGSSTYDTTIKVADITAGNTLQGGDLTVSAGSATAGSNMAGGHLILKAGNSRTGSTHESGDLRLYAGANNFVSGGTFGDIEFYRGGLNGSYTQAMTLVGSTGNVGIGTTSPSDLLSVAGSFNLTGALKANGNAGTSGYVLQTTGSGVQWVATSTLGISGGGSSQWTTSGSDIYYDTGKASVGTTTPFSDSKFSVVNSVVSTSNSAAVRGYSYVNSGEFTGNSYGGYFFAAGNGNGQNVGVYGSADYTTGASGYAYGVWGTSDGVGVYGSGTDTGVHGTGMTGVYGTSNNASGKAGYFNQSNASGYSLYASGGINYLQNNVGIGTTTPSAKLSVTGTAGTADVFAIASSTNARMLTVTSLGNLGLGIAPSARAHFLSTTEQLRLGYDATNYVAITVAADGNINFTANGTDPEFAFMNNMGINTSAPSAELDIYGANGGAANINLMRNDSTTVADDELGGVAFGSTDGPSPNAAAINAYATENYSSSAAGSYMTFRTSQTGGDTLSERMRITDIGNVGIGTTSPQRKLHVRTTADEAPVRFEDSSGYCEINPISTTWSCTSDERLKDNIRDLATVQIGTSTDETVLERISNLRPVAFTWKSDESQSDRTGLIAQEVEKIFPDLVNTDERGYKSVSYGGFTVYIISAVKELVARLENVESAVASLSGSMVSNVQTGLSSIVSRLTVGSAEKPTGITLYDEETGEPYCLKVRNGETTTTPGECTVVDLTPDTPAAPPVQTEPGTTTPDTSGGTGGDGSNGGTGDAAQPPGTGDTGTSGQSTGTGDGSTSGSGDGAATGSPAGSDAGSSSTAGGTPSSDGSSDTSSGDSGSQSGSAGSGSADGGSGDSASSSSGGSSAGSSGPSGTDAGGV